MKTPRFSTVFPRRVIIFATGGAVLLILGGSLIALDQAGIGPVVFAQYINETISRLAGANLTVRSDRTILPADGHATTTLHITTTNPNLPVTGSVTSGGGTVSAGGDPASLIYTAGSAPGPVTVVIKCGSLTQTIALTLQEAIVPATPVLVTPLDKSTTSDPTSEVSGTGPPNTKILITDNGSLNTTLTADDKGSFRGNLAKPLYSGQHTFAAIASSDLGVLSPVSNLITITVQAEPVKLDANHIQLFPSHPIAGNSFGLFVPASLNTTRVTSDLLGRSFELTDLHKTSVFSGTLPVPDQAGSYTINLTLYDIAGAATRFDKAVNFLAVSG